MASSDGTASPAASPARRAVFRLLAATLGSVLVLGGMEAALRLAGIGDPTGFLLHSKARGTNMWTENPRFTWRFMPPEMGRTPQPLAVPVQRPPRSIRVVVLGESAAMGDPEPAVGFPRTLETLLRARFPGRHVEVVNAAVTAINSHVIRDMAPDLANLQADAWVVYMGNNEVTGPFGPGTIFGSDAPPGPLVRVGMALRRTRVGQAMAALASGLASGAQSRRAWGGLEMFLERQVLATDPRLPAVRNAFEENLRAIIRAGRAAGARVIVSTVAVNLRDSAPFGSSNDPALKPDIMAAWSAAFAEGKAAEFMTNGRAARAAYDRALSMDGDHAELMYRRSRLALAVGDTNAIPGFARARDLDTLRFRADADLNSVIRRVAAGREAEGIWLVDAERTFGQNAPGGIPGDELFWEHVHFRLPGSYLLALLTGTALMEALPQALREGAQPEWIQLDEVSRRLVLTSWGDHRIAEGVRARCRRPPFSTQANAAERDARLQRELASLGKGIMPTAFNPQADAFRKRIAEAPDDWVLHDQFGRLHESFGDVAGATNAWRKVIELVPHHFGARIQMGRMLATRDDTAAEAEAWLREADRMRPGTAELQVALGQALARQKRFREADAAFALATRLRPDLLDAHVQWGVALAGEGRDTDAVARLESALALSTNSALSHLHLARIARKQGDTNRARARYAEVLRLSPNYREARDFMGTP